jgi:hypothetical protein
MPLRSNRANGLKRKENRPISFLLPAILAVLVHLSFFGFKRAVPSENPHSERPKQVLFLPQQTVIEEEKRLLAWMDIMDPTYFIEPNRKHGFSRTYNSGGMKDIPIKLDNSISKYGKKESFLPVPWKPKYERIKEQWPYSPSDIKAVDISKFRKNFDFPVWMSEESDLLPQLFSDLDKLKEKLKDSPPEFHETVLEVEFFGPNFFPKVKVIHSCGNPEFDTIALKTLTVKGKRLAMNDKDSRETRFITVKWYSN